MRVNIVAMGMGSASTLTLGALGALRSSELLIGAQRLLDAAASVLAEAKGAASADAGATVGALGIPNPGSGSGSGSSSGSGSDASGALAPHSGAPASSSAASDADAAPNSPAFASPTAPVSPSPEQLCLTSPSAIRDALNTCADHVRTASVLVSGDVGFYSLAPHLYRVLDGYDVEVFPGVSSPVYFCAKIGVPWQDVHCLSAHGRTVNAVGAVQSHATTFLLTGGATCAHDICRELAESSLAHVRVHVGERLSYADERIVSGTAAELAAETFDDLAVMLVENPRPLTRPHGAPALPDEAFTRGNVPMTKHDVRTLALARLRIAPTSTVWDVGAGTGSVSVECALAAFEGRVFAVERNAEAVALIRENSDSFGTCNLRVAEGLAPDALASLPAPDCVFVGGSAGHLEGIFRCALKKNPAARVVVAAITLETVAEAVRCLSEFRLVDTDITQISVAKARTAGQSHLMMGQNPVYLISGTGAGAGSGDEGASAKEQAAACACESTADQAGSAHA